MVIDVPPAIQQLVGDPSVPIIFTEGARKADAAVSAGLAGVDLIGVGNTGSRVCRSVAREKSEMGYSLGSEGLTEPEQKLAGQLKLPGEEVAILVRRGADDRRLEVCGRGSDEGDMP